jgi:prepilin-type N-terminal cleavage/methylation domain-containing protein
MRPIRRRSQAGFTLLEVLVATLILGVAVAALMSNLSTSTANLIRGTETDRLTALSKSKMDELIAQAGPLNGVLEGPLDVDSAGKLRGGWRATVSLEAMAAGSFTRLERIVLETWLQSGSRRRSLILETFRRVPGPGSGGG